MNQPAPKRWHIYIVALQPRVGTKPGKQRPCLVIQPNEFGEEGLSSTVILPITTKTLGGAAHPLRVRIPKGVCGLTQESDLMIDQILAWDNELFREDLGEIPQDIQEKVRLALKEFLDLGR